MPFRINPFTGTLSPVIEGTDVSTSNPKAIIYIKGSEFIDGSRRLIIAPDNQIELQERQNGVWNLTGIEVSDESLHLGHGLDVAAIASSMLIKGVLNAEESLSLDIGFNVQGSKFPRTPRVQPRLNNVVVQPDSTLSVTGKILAIPTITFLRTYIYAIYLFIGDVVPTSGINLVGETGQVTGAGNIFFDHHYSPSLFTANTISRFTLGSGLGVVPGINIILTFKSDNNFSFRGTSGGVFYQAYDIQNYEYEELLSFNTGTNKVLTSRNQGSILVDRSGNLISTDKAVAV